MKSVFIIKDRAEDLFMVVISDQSGSTFKPMTENAKELSSYLADEYSKTSISKPELTQSIDESMTIEGPSPYNSLTREKISTLSQKSETSLEIVPVTSVSEVALSEFSHDEFMNVVSYKAASFIADRTKTTFGYEVKRVRAMWDPSLSIPGTNRRGGWRCPVGTRYGGQITDRFGRQCGWGVARRIANAVSNIGERLESLDDRKRNRRLERRNARMVGYLQGRGGGRVERGLRGVADVLDGGSTPSVRPQGRAVKPSTPNIIDAVEPRVPRQRRNKPRRRPQPSQVEPSQIEPQRPARPVRPARPARPARPVDGERLTIEEASDAQLSEPFSKYVTRKYGEYARNVRLLNEQGKPAGMMTRRQWYAVNKPNLRDAWKDVHGRSAPQDFEPAPPRRPRNNRANRRNASVQQARRTASRRPEPNDVPEPAPARPARPARRNKVAEEQAARNALQNALTEANQDPGYVLVNKKFDKDVEAILRQPQAVPEKKLDELIGMLEEQENQIRARNRRARQMGQPPDPDDVAMLQRLSPQHRKLREARTAARLARNASSAPSSPQSALTPKTPGDGGAPNARRVQNALPEGWNQGPGTIITHENGDIIDQPIGQDTWFVIFRGGSKQGLATREDAIAWHKANVLGLGSSAPTPAKPVRPVRRPTPKPKAVGNPQIELGSKWTKRRDGTWDRNGYNLIPFFDADGKLAKFAIETPVGETYEQRYGGPQNERGINLFAESLYGIAGGESANPIFSDEDTPPSVTTPNTPTTPARAPRAPRASQKSPLRPYNREGDPHGVLPIERGNGGLGKWVDKEDRRINTTEKAIEHIKNGGDLQKVPSQFMFEAMFQNSSSDDTDLNKRFRRVTPNGGAIGFTQLFFLRGQDGKKTNQGWVLKASRDGDNVGELVGWNFLAEVGMIGDGAIVDGRVDASPALMGALGRYGARAQALSGAQFVVTPMAFNDVPNDHEIGPDGGPNRDYVLAQLQRAPDRGISARLAGFMTNYILGVSDRHAGNGIGRIVTAPDGTKKALVVPIDLGWVGQNHGGTVAGFGQGFRMDPDLMIGRNGQPPKLQQELQLIMNLDKRRQAYREMIQTFDDVISKAEKVLSVTKDSFVEDALKNQERTADNVRRAERIYDGMKVSLTKMKATRTKVVGYLPVGER